MLRIEPARFGVDRVGFTEIDHRVAAAYTFKLESVHQFLTGHLLAIVFRAPAQQAEKIHVGMRQETGVAVGGDTNDRAVLTFGKLGSVGRDQ